MNWELMPVLACAAPANAESTPGPPIRIHGGQAYWLGVGEVPAVPAAAPSTISLFSPTTETIGTRG